MVKSIKESWIHGWFFLVSNASIGWTEESPSSSLDSATLLSSKALKAQIRRRGRPLGVMEHRPKKIGDENWWVKKNHGFSPVLETSFYEVGMFGFLDNTQ